VILRRHLATSLALCLFAAPALADDPWAEGLHAELEAGDYERALELYATAAQRAPARAEEAHLRRASVFAKLRDPAGVERALRAYRQVYPDGELSARAARIEADVAGWMAARAKPERSKQALRMLLKTRRVTLNFEGLPLSEALDFLRDITQLNAVLGPQADGDAPITVALRDVSLGKALELIATLVGVKLEVRNTVVVLGPGPRTTTGPLTAEDVALYPEGFRALRESRLTVNFPHIPLSEVLAFLRDVTQLNLAVAAGVDQDQTVDLRLADVSLEMALTLALEQVGARHSLGPQAVVITAPR
jgi:tetratricopeptide (TPR) repeat protein